MGKPSKPVIDPAKMRNRYCRKRRKPNVDFHSGRAVELFAILYDQVGVQKVIDRLNAVKEMLPEKPKDEAAN
jgi:two-component SAPR family response regulator